VAGNFKENKAKDLAKKYFGQADKNKSGGKFAAAKISQDQPRASLLKKETEQVQVCLGVPAYALGDEKMYPLFLLAVILGGNMSSRLFTVVREQHGLAYYVKSDISAYQDTGAFLIQAGLDKTRIKQAIKLILAELKKVGEAGVTDKELADAKEFIKGKLVLELEDSENVADWYGKQTLLLGKVLAPEAKIKKIFAVKKSALQKVAQELFQEKYLNLAMIGPFDQTEEFRQLLKLS
jgi:predicted Zn-dependent peptidase